MSKGFGEAPIKPHFLGHRERLRERFREAGPDALPDYELLEMILFRAKMRGDTKPLAKALIAKFGSFAEVISAAPERLKEVDGVGDAVTTELKLIRAAALRLMKGGIVNRPLLSSWSAILEPGTTVKTRLGRPKPPHRMSYPLGSQCYHVVSPTL